ncbi:CLUMA_CG007551, isoform A [Clunio marinus]|uniref:CLUMA_CG007551, isoform A n=1 Tax=Clunio marinus TaxID=568069 RepID=A0A1J1I1E6_9DIPT|nr:CLUMA_CG007551, isoform A [Clunio marinus]
MGGNRGNFRNQRRNFRGGRKENFNSRRKESNRFQSDRRENKWQTEERLSEKDVGANQFISTTKGFQGIIKSRYSDFHVNEIDLDGNEAVLSEFALPEISEETVEPEEDYEVEFKELINEEQRKLIEQLIDSKNEEESKSVLIDVTDFDKDKRSKLHKILRSIHGDKIFNNTISENDKKFIQINKSTMKEKARGHAWKWPHEFTYFILHKENIDTLQAIALLSQKLGVKPSFFTYAGTKDKRAKTSQWISVKKMEPNKICQTAKKCQGIRVGNFKFEPECLRLGCLKGNRFRIALRSINGDEKEIEKSLQSLRDIGFLNYYGLQRFGNCVKVPTYLIGKALLASDFKLACELILQERDGEPFYMQKMRKCYAETKDPKQTLDCLHTTNTCVEARLLHGFIKNGSTNYLQALLNLPRNMLMLYTHAYQSLIFNKVASKRRELGLNVLEGDLIFTEEPKVETEGIEINQELSEDEACEETIESKFLTMVRHLTADDVNSGNFTIYDIVLPLPGYDIKYPSNVVGSFYDELLSIDELSSEKLKNKQPVFSLTGAYRKVFVKPENFSWKFMKYQNHDANLILSDYSKIFKDPEPEDDPEGKNMAIILDFILPSSTYATMALRELMKHDTSVESQISLEKEIREASEVKDSDGIVVQKEETIDDDEPDAKKCKTE